MTIPECLGDNLPALKNLKPWLPFVLVALWAILNLICLESWPNLMAFGDEAWFSDVAWNLAQNFRLANEIFPFTSLEKGLGVVAETVYYVPLAAIFRFAGVGLFQARLLSLLAAAATILALAYRLRGTPAWIAVALSPSFLLAAHTARPESTGVMVLTVYLLLAISDAWALIGIVGGLSFFVSPIVGFWVSGAFLAWLMLSRGWKPRLRAVALFALSCLVGLGLTALLGGPRFLASDIYGQYYIPILENQNPLFLLRAVAKKAYWLHLVSLKDPVITLLFGAGLVSTVARRFRLEKEEWMIWLSAACGVILTGLVISRTPDYYFVYLSVPAALAGGLALRPLRQAYSLAIAGFIGLVGLGKTILDARRLPPSDSPSGIMALREEIPDGAGVVGPTNLWYVLHKKRLIVPVFGEMVQDRKEFTARIDSLSPGFVVLSDRDTSGWLWELAGEGVLVREIPFRGYTVSSRTGIPEPLHELMLYRLKPRESGACRDKAGGR